MMESWIVEWQQFRKVFRCVLSFMRRIKKKISEMLKKKMNKMD